MWAKQAFCRQLFTGVNAAPCRSRSKQIALVFAREGRAFVGVRVGKALMALRRKWKVPRDGL